MAWNYSLLLEVFLFDKLGRFLKSIWEKDHLTINGPNRLLQAFIFQEGNQEGHYAVKSYLFYTRV